MSADVPSLSVDDVARIQAQSFLAGSEFHVEATSTNDLAMNRVREGEWAVPHLVVAERQTAGRGRRGNSWWAGPGSLTFSVIIDPTTYGLSPERRGLLAPLAGLAVAEALSTGSPDCEVGLKWPNDIQLAGRKIGGILVEIPAQSPLPKSQLAVIGIGLNVNNSLADAPAELRSLATSLVDKTGEQYNRAALLMLVLQRLEHWLTTVAHDADGWQDSWRPLCVLTGSQVEILDGSRRITGLCRGISADGALLIKTAEGLQPCSAGTVVSVC